MFQDQYTFNIVIKITTRTSRFKNCLFFLLFFLWPFFGLSQKDSQELVDLAYLEHLVKIKVDSVRGAHNMPMLVNDSILFVAAKDHSDYLSNQDEISHFQKKKLKKAPQDRVNLYGALNYLAGENVLSYPFDQSYERTAKNMVDGWVNSPGHFKNIITQKYQLTGLAITVHKVNGNYIAVQVFAHVPFKYNFNQYRSEFFKYSIDTSLNFSPTRNEYLVKSQNKIPWNLKPYDWQWKKCKECKPLINNKLSIQLKRKENNIYGYTLNPKVFSGLFAKRKDGMAIEIVNYEPYRCENPQYYTIPSRRNLNSSINGQILKPVYKSDLLKDLKEQKKQYQQEKRHKIRNLRQANASKAKIKRIEKEKWHPQYTEFNLGTIDGINGNDYMELNLLYINKKKIRLPIYYSGLCGSPDFQDSLNLDMLSMLKDTLPTIPSLNKQFRFKLFFALNEIDTDSLKIKEILTQVKGWKIDSILIKAYASVEGNFEINAKLHQDRANKVYRQLHNHVDSTTKFILKHHENWPLFYKQITRSKFKHWKHWEHAEIKKALLDSAVLKKWRKKLDQQRVAYVYIKASKTERDTLQYILDNYNDNDPKAALLKQQFLYSLWKKGKVPHTCLTEIEYPIKERFLVPITNQFAFIYQNGLETKQQLYQRIKSLQTFARDHDLLLRNTVFYQVSNLSLNSEKDHEILLKSIKRLEKNILFRESAGLMKTTYFLKTLPYYSNINDIKLQKEGLDHVYDFYTGDTELAFDKEKTLGLAKFFIHFNRITDAYDVLSDYLMESGFDRDIFVLYLKSGYIHPERQKDRSFSKYLLDARKKLSNKDWCTLFIGPCNISFQIFDDELIRDIYCKECKAYDVVPN